MHLKTFSEGRGHDFGFKLISTSQPSLTLASFNLFQRDFAEAEVEAHLSEHGGYFTGSFVALYISTPFTDTTAMEGKVYCDAM